MKFRIRKTTSFAGDYFHLQLKRWWGWETVDYSWSPEFLKETAKSYEKQPAPVIVEQWEVPS